MRKSLGGIRNDYVRRLGFSSIRGTNPQETTPSNAGNTPNSQSVDQVSVSQTLGSATTSNLGIIKKMG